MSNPLTRSCTAFAGQRLLFAGPLAEVALSVARSSGMTDAVLVFDDATGAVVDLDLRGNEGDILERLSNPAKRSAGLGRPKADETSGTATLDDSQRGRGRPKLGVIAREVTLMPRQWEWLATQSGGASATLRRLVDDARKVVNPRQHRRAAQDTAYRFMQAIAGDLPGYEEATRSLFADDLPGLEQTINAWPEDIRAHALRLAVGPSAPG